MHAAALVALVAAWLFAAVFAIRTRPGERLGRLAMMGAAIGGVGIAAAAADVAAVSTVAIVVLPAFGMHLGLSVPDGSCRLGRAAVGSAYAGALAAGVAVAAADRVGQGAVLAGETALAIVVAGVGSRRRYMRATGAERQRLQWFGWAVATAIELGAVMAGVSALVGAPPAGVVAAVVTLPFPVALAASAARQPLVGIDQLLALTISVVGLTGVIAATYGLVLLGLGRAPNRSERSLLALSMIAAAAAAVVFGPARVRLTDFARRIVYGEREPPDAVLRTLGSRLSRAVPFDELLSQVCDSLRSSLALSRTEMWIGDGQHLDRVVSRPDVGGGRLMLTQAERAVVARAGVSGSAWARVWLPQLADGDDVVRIAAVAHAGELLGIIVAARPATTEAFTPEEDAVLAELARQLGLALHNVRLDSALRDSLDEVSRQADELRASRSRVVAAADAARRKIERDLHDGAQQHLVALAINVRLARQLVDSDAAAAAEMLDALGGELREAVQELRNLAHGIYPPLLVDRGLPEALQAAANRASLATTVATDGIGRYDGDVEAAAYFCCLEALQNAGKHAGDGASACVRVWEVEGGLLFEVADDGAGFDPTARAEPGAGFVNMADRVGAIGGSLAVQSAPGQGTKVSGRIPLGDRTRVDS